MPTMATLSPAFTCAVLTHRAHAGEHGAAEQRRFVEGERLVDLHQRPLGDDGGLRKRRDADVMVDRPAALVNAARAREQRAGAVRRRTRLAQRRPPGGARNAVAAARHEHQHDMIARHDRGDAGPDLAHDARCFMPQRHRHHPRPVAVDHRQIGMAEPRRLDLHQHFARARRIELDLADDERLALRVRRRRAHDFEDRCFHAHDLNSASFRGAREAREPGIHNPCACDGTEAEKRQASRTHCPYAVRDERARCEFLR